MEEQSKYHLYINNLISIYLSNLEKLREELGVCSSEDTEYIKGQIMSIYDNLTTMQSQAELFDIDLSILNKVDLEKYLTL